jgi:predicted DNA-binding transcriptional regulator AlpA
LCEPRPGRINAPYKWEDRVLQRPSGSPRAPKDRPRRRLRAPAHHHTSIIQPGATAPGGTDPMIHTDSTAAAPVLLPLRTFLKRYAISKSSFYRRASEMPPVIKIGRSTLVSVAEADAWARSKLMPATALCGRA